MSWDSSKQKYEVQIPGDGGVLNHVGYVTEVVPAAKLYDQAMWQVYGEQAQHKLNFPSSKTPSSMPAAMAKKGTNGKSPGVGADAPGPDLNKIAEPTSSEEDEEDEEDEEEEEERGGGRGGRGGL